ncbi:hypothetical protein HWV62_25462 [Athelia sp. TMB]|nr:hypothetical protein HWV62_25462 [Athelia sp. TMB]
MHSKPSHLFLLTYLKLEDIAEPEIQERVEQLVRDSEQSHQMACHAAVFVIILDLSFFIWDKDQSKECVKEALLIYEQADANHKAVMVAVHEACAAKEGESEEDMAVFIEKMKEIVLAHRLSESYRT